MRLFSSVAVALSIVLPVVSHAAGYREKVRVMPPALKAPSSSLGGVTMTFDFMDTRGDGAVGQSGSRIWVVDNLEPTWGPAVRRAMQDSGAVVVAPGKDAPWALTVELGKIEMEVDMLGGFVKVNAVATLMRGGEQVWRKNLDSKKKISGVSDLGVSISKVLAPVLEEALERAGNQLTRNQAGAAETTAAAPAPAPSGAQPRLAVLEFRGELPFATLKLLGDEARAGVLEGAGPQRYLVMTRDSLAALAKEKCPTPDGCDVEMGKKVGADVVVTGDVVKLGKKLRTSIKVLDTHNGALLASKSFSVEGEDALLDQVKATVAAAIKGVP